jgi:hypothetical protein
MLAGNVYIANLNNNPDTMPTLQGYCLEAGVSPSNLNDYRVKFPEVDQLCDTITLEQENFLLTRAINNKSNPIFSMFLLKSKHGYHDQPQSLTQNNSFNISPDLLADALKLMAGKSKG